MDDEDDYPVTFPVGNATPAGGADEDRAVGRLWVPDLESRSGWSGHWVYPESRKADRRVGFGRRR